MLNVLTFLLCIQLSTVTVSAAASDALAQTPGQAAARENPRQATLRQDGPMPKRNMARRGGPEEQVEVTPPTGPMRVLFHSIAETRARSVYEDAPAPPATLRFTGFVTGERLGELVGVGSLAIEEMTDDTGAVLTSPAELTEADRTATRAVRISPRLMRKGGFQRTREIKAHTSREARKLTKITGWVNVVYGGDTEEILIDNPLQYVGGVIQHPRLKEIGLNIEVVEIGSEVQEQKNKKGIGLRLGNGVKQIKRLTFFDAWMRPTHPKNRIVQPENGEPYMYYPFTVGQADVDTQLLLEVYPKIEEQRISFEFKDIELP